MSRLTATASLICVVAGLGPRTAAAERPKPWAVYGGLSLEAAMAGTFYLNFSDLADHVGDNARVWTGFIGSTALTLGGGYLGHRFDLDPRPALAVHGAVWFGLEGFMLGTLVDGRDQAWGLRVGRTAWTLGAVGAVAGAVVGGRFVDGRDETSVWFGGPTIGFAAGGIVIGGLMVLIGGIDGDTASGQFVTGATVGLTVGLGAATALAIHGFGDTAPERRRQLAQLARYLPRVAARDDRVTLTIAGQF